MTCVRSHGRTQAGFQDGLSPAHCVSHSTQWPQEGEDDRLVFMSTRGRENRHIFLPCSKLIGPLGREKRKKRQVAKTFLEGGIGKHGGKPLAVNGDHIRKMWGKGFVGFLGGERILNCFSFSAIFVLSSTLFLISTQHYSAVIFLFLDIFITLFSYYAVSFGIYSF